MLMRDLDMVLSHMTGRDLTVKDVQDALGMPKATYYTQRDQGRLDQPANLLKLARAFDVNPVVLLVEYDHITADEVRHYSEEDHPPQDIATMKRAVLKKRPVQADFASDPGGVEADGGQRQVVLEIPATVGAATQAQIVEALRQAFDKLDGDSERPTASHPPAT